MIKKQIRFKMGPKTTRVFNHMDLVRFAGPGTFGKNLSVHREDLPMDVFYKVLRRDRY